MSRSALKRWQTATVVLLGAFGGLLVISVATAWVRYLAMIVGWPEFLAARDPIWRELPQEWFDLIRADLGYYPDYSAPMMVAAPIIGAQAAWSYRHRITAPARASRGCILTAWLLVMALTMWRIHVYLQMVFAYHSVSGYAIWSLKWFLAMAVILVDPSLLCAMALLWWGYALRRRSRPQEARP